MVLIVAVDEILHDGAALKQVDGAAVGKGVRQRRDAAVGVDVEEPLLLQRVQREEALSFAQFRHMYAHRRSIARPFLPSACSSRCRWQ